MTARHVAVAPLVVVKDRAGVDQYFYRGQEIVADIDADRLKALAAAGLIEGVKAAAAASDGPPAKSAKKADWEAYAVAQGWSEVDATSAKKDELVEALTADTSGSGGDGSDAGDGQGESGESD